MQGFGDITAKNQPSPTLLRAIRAERSSLTLPRRLRGEVVFEKAEAAPGRRRSFRPLIAFVAIAWVLAGWALLG